MKHIKLFAPLSLLVVLVLALSGCGAGAQMSAADIIAKMRETMKTTQTSQGVADLALTINKDGLKTLAQGLMGGANAPVSDMPAGKDGGDWTSKLPDSASATIKTWRQAPDKARIEVQSSTIPGAKGATLVYDGQKVYAYDPANNTVYEGTPEKLMDKIPADIKAVIQGVDAEKQIDKLIDAADIKLLGTEKIAGFDAYKLDITPKADAATRLDIPKIFQMQAGVIIKDLHVVLWVDTTRWVPLKATIEHPNMGSFAATASQLTLNQPIDPSTFVLQVPAGAKRVDLDAMADTMGPKSTTLPEARAAAQKEGWTLLEPSYVPANATLIEVLSMPNSGIGSKTANMPTGSNFTLNYSSPTTSFSIMESRMEIPKGLGDEFSGRADTVIKDVPLRGTTAKAFSPDGANWTALSWQEKSTGIWVAIHGKLSLDEAVKIAEGLK
jgi:outer membrane lipoprotein-sorting protein